MSEELKLCVCGGVVDYKSQSTDSNGAIWANLECKKCAASFHIIEKIWQQRPIEDALRNDLQIAVEALDNIWNNHRDYIENHINVSQHAYDLADIAWKALIQINAEMENVDN